MYIYGAGMAGLLAGNMLRRFSPIVREAQPELPDNHGALLRFRSEAVAAASGQTFRKVRVQKAVKSFGALHTRASLRDNNRYSYKVTGSFMDRSVMNMDPSDRWIAPPDFLPGLARGLEVQYGMPLSPGIIASLGNMGPIISTIPMPALMGMVEWEEQPDFKFKPIWSVTVDLGPHVSLFQTIYYPDEGRYYRASITDSRLIIEYAEDPHWNKAVPVREFLHNDLVRTLEDFGIDFKSLPDLVVEVKQQKYGKLLPIDERLRRRFIMHMTNEYNVFSVGRFATWRQILLDDVVRDIQLVASWIDGEDYQRRMHWSQP